jgi:hypothetical protein
VLISTEAPAGAGRKCGPIPQDLSPIFSPLHLNMRSATFAALTFSTFDLLSRYSKSTVLSLLSFLPKNKCCQSCPSRIDLSSFEGLRKARGLGSKRWRRVVQTRLLRVARAGSCGRDAGEQDTRNRGILTRMLAAVCLLHLFFCFWLMHHLRRIYMYYTHLRTFFLNGRLE